VRTGIAPVSCSMKRKYVFGKRSFDQASKQGCSCQTLFLDQLSLYFAVVCATRYNRCFGQVKF
jgi:hypothetical protein